MANVKIVGDAIVVTSEVKFETLEKMARIAPEALTLYKDKTPIFKIGTGGCSLNNNGAIFAKANAGGFAELTIGCAFTGEDKKTQFIDAYGVALARLNATEAEVMVAADDFEAQMEDVAASVEQL